MAYPIDPELVPWLGGIPKINLAEVEEARRRSAELVGQGPRYEPLVPVSIRDLTVRGPEGAPEVPVRVYSTGGDVARPGLLYIHGGAFVTGDVPTFDNDCLRIAADIGAVVVSVEYRRAPEDPFPAGVEDCYAALCWTAAHAESLGIDPARLGVGGESSGGGLAAAVALMARDRGGPRLCFQWLGIPQIDDRLATPSAVAFTDTPSWNRPSAEISWRHYLGPGVPGSEGVSPYAAPARAASLAGLPPAFVTACEFDPLRDEDLAYAVRLIQAGVPTEIAHYPGTFHGSHLLKSATSDRMIADQTAALRRGLRADADAHQRADADAHQELQ